MNGNEYYDNLSALGGHVVAGHGRSLLEMTRMLRALAGEGDREAFLNATITLLAFFDYFVQTDGMGEEQYGPLVENAKLGFDTVMALQTLYCVRNGWHDETPWQILPMGKPMIQLIEN